MESWGGERGPDRSWERGPRWARPSRPGRKLRLFGWELCLVSPNERATRALLAEVYRVPPEWLDDVIRVRLANLER
jgi:hypothetical protein